MTKNDAKIPEGWEEKHLGELMSTMAGIAAPNRLIGKGDVPFVRMKDLGDYHLTTRLVNAEGKIRKEDVKKHNLPIVKEGAILIPRSGSVHLNHRAILGVDAVIVSHIVALAANREICNFLLYYILCRYDMTKIMTQTTGLNAISFESLNKIRFAIPTCAAEQSKIAEILYTVDEAIETTETLIKKHQRIRRGLTRALLTKGIDEDGNIRDEKTHKFKDSPLGRIPVEWESLTVNELLSKRILAETQDGNHGELHPKASDFVKDGVPFIMATDIAEGEIDFENCKKISFAQYKKLRTGFAKPKDVLLSHKASIGFVAIVPDNCRDIMLTPQVTYYRISKSDELYFKYLQYYFQNPVFQKLLENFSKQSTRSYIGILAQRNLTIQFPRSMEEQRSIASFLSQIDAIIQQEQTYKRKLMSLKRGLVEDLLTGNPRVNHLLN